MNDRRDALISEIVGGAWGGRAWEELTALAEQDPSVWRRLAEAQRDQAGLEHLLDDAVAVAERVEMPAPAGGGGDAWGVGPASDAAHDALPSSFSDSWTRPRVGPRRAPDRDVHRPWSRWRSGAGWAVAAMILLTWSAGLRSPDRGSSVRGGGAVSLVGGGATGYEAGLLPTASAADAFQAYLDRGRAEGTVLSPEPQRVLLRTRPVTTGEGIEIIYLKQVMERAVVPSLYEFSGEDEQGRPGLVRYRGDGGGRM